MGVGGGPSRSRAKALGQEPPGQESAAPREAGALKICTGFFKEGKALSRELRQILRRGSGGASSLPESPTEVMRRGGEGAAHPGPSWVKGWSAPRGPGGKLRRRLRAEGAASCYLGEPWPESMIPAAQVPDLRVLGDTAQDPALPQDRQRWGGPRTARTLLPLGAPKLCKSAPHPREHPGQCGLGASVVTAGADSRAGELATASRVVPPGVTLCLGEAGPPGNKGLMGGKQLPLSPAPGGGGGAAPPGAHT